MKKATLFFLVFFLLLLLASSDLYAQCAMCKATATSNLEGGGNVGRGINTGILYLMAVPYLIVLFLFRKQVAGFFKMFLTRNSAK